MCIYRQCGLTGALLATSGSQHGAAAGGVPEGGEVDAEGGK